jgi:hypothetical protein
MIFGHWQYEGKLDPSKHFGFLYLIINKQNGFQYVGIKQFSFKRGAKRSNSHWEDYTGSSKWLNADIAKLGKDNFKFIIIDVFDSKQSLHYAELKYMIQNNCLWSKQWYNQQVRARVVNVKTKA